MTSSTSYKKDEQMIENKKDYIYVNGFDLSRPVGKSELIRRLGNATVQDMKDRPDLIKRAILNPVRGSKISYKEDV